MKHAAKMDSGTMIYISIFIKIGSSNQKLFGGGGTHASTYRQQDDFISLVLFFLNKESRPKTIVIVC
jgi:hypothetical protein